MKKEHTAMKKKRPERAGKSSRTHRALILKSIEEAALPDSAVDFLLLAASSCSTKARLNQSIKTLSGSNEELGKTVLEYSQESVADKGECELRDQELQGAGRFNPWKHVDLECPRWSAYMSHGLKLGLARPLMGCIGSLRGTLKENV